MSELNFRISQPQPAKKKKVLYIRKKVEEPMGSESHSHMDRSLTMNILQKHMSKMPHNQLNNKKDIDAISVANKKESLHEDPEEDDIKAPFSEVTGPQLRIEKTYLSFIQKTGLVATDSINVYNNGSTAIYYEWVKTETLVSFNSTLADKEERFFCHHVRNTHFFWLIF